MLPKFWLRTLESRFWCINYYSDLTWSDAFSDASQCIPVLSLMRMDSCSALGHQSSAHIHKYPSPRRSRNKLISAPVPSEHIRTRARVDVQRYKSWRQFLVRVPTGNTPYCCYSRSRESAILHLASITGFSGGCTPPPPSAATGIDESQYGADIVRAIKVSSRETGLEQRRRRSDACEDITARAKSLFSSARVSFVDVRIFAGRLIGSLYLSLLSLLLFFSIYSHSSIAKAWFLNPSRFSIECSAVFIPR